MFLRLGGEGGIRNLGTLLGYGALAKRCFRPLSHLTKIGFCSPGPVGRRRALGAWLQMRGEYAANLAIANRSEVRSQKSEVRSQKSEVGGRRSNKPLWSHDKRELNGILQGKLLASQSKGMRR